MLLEDDKGIQPAQNLTPAVNADFLADNPDIEDIFNELSAALTTEDLAEMNVKVDVERAEARGRRPASSSRTRACSDVEHRPRSR